MKSGVDIEDTKNRIESYKKIIRGKKFTAGYRESCKEAVKSLESLLKEQKTKTMRKERRGLAFRVTIEFMNEIFDLLKRRKYKLVPKDAQIHAIGGEDMMWCGYTIVIISKEFPIVEEGRMCDKGYIKVDKERGIIELKERK